MSAERRFQTSYRETDTTDPGLVLEDDGTIWQVKPDGTREQIGTANGGSQPISPLTADLDTGGFALTDRGGLSTLKLAGTNAGIETDLDIEIHSTDEDINVTSDFGSVNITTDPDNGGDVLVQTGGTLDLQGNGASGAQVSAGESHCTVVAATYSSIEGGFGEGILRMQEDGSMWFRVSTEVPDGDLVAGRWGLWLDPSNGAAKLKIKAKTLDGTVVTGEIPLA